MDRTFSIILMGLSALIFGDGFAMADAQTTYNVSPGPLPFDESDDPVTPDSAFQFIEDISTHPDFVRVTTSNGFKDTRPAERGEFEAVGKASIVSNGYVRNAGTVSFVDPGFPSRRTALMSAHAFFDKKGALIAPLKNYIVELNRDPLSNNYLESDSPTDAYSFGIKSIICMTKNTMGEMLRDQCMVSLDKDIPSDIELIKYETNPSPEDFKGELYTVAYPSAYGFGRVRAVSKCKAMPSSYENGIKHNCDCGPGCSGSLIFNKKTGKAIAMQKATLSKEINSRLYKYYYGLAYSLNILNSDTYVEIDRADDQDF